MCMIALAPIVHIHLDYYASQSPDEYAWLSSATLRIPHSCCLFKQHELMFNLEVDFYGIVFFLVTV